MAEEATTTAGAVPVEEEEEEEEEAVAAAGPTGGEGEGDGEEGAAPSGGSKKKGRTAAPAEPDPNALQIPKASVKRIMRLNNDVKALQPDAIVMASKSTELFLSDFARKAAQITMEAGRKSIRYEDVVAVIDNADTRMEFLRDALPPQQPEG